MSEEDEYTKSLLAAEQALVAAIRARPTTFAPVLMDLLKQVRELLKSLA